MSFKHSKSANENVLLLLLMITKKSELLEWFKRNHDQLLKHELHATGTTGKLIESTLDIPVIKYKSGPLGGDQQLGAKIADQSIDILISTADFLLTSPFISSTYTRIVPSFEHYLKQEIKNI